MQWRPHLVVRGQVDAIAGARPSQDIAGLGIVKEVARIAVDRHGRPLETFSVSGKVNPLVSLSSTCSLSLLLFVPSPLPGLHLTTVSHYASPTWGVLSYVVRSSLYGEVLA